MVICVCVNLSLVSIKISHESIGFNKIDNKKNTLFIIKKTKFFSSLRASAIKIKISETRSH